MHTNEPRDIPSLVSEILTSKHLSHNILIQLGRLLIADASFNAWCANRKSSARHSPPPAGRDGNELSSQDVERFADEQFDECIGLLEDSEDIFTACKRGWHDFRAAEWPRGDFEHWRRNHEVFQSVLESCALRTDKLGAALGRRSAS